MDCASSEFFKDGIYDYTKFEGDHGVKRTIDEQVEFLSQLVEKYPYRLDRRRYGWRTTGKVGRSLPTSFGKKIQLVGDDLFITNVEYLRRGIAEGCGNSILIKVNQIGTLYRDARRYRYGSPPRLHPPSLTPLW